MYEETRNNVTEFYGITSRSLGEVVGPGGADGQEDDDDSGLAY